MGSVYGHGCLYMCRVGVGVRVGQARDDSIVSCMAPNKNWRDMGVRICVGLGLVLRLVTQVMTLSSDA